jgi:hypothetical protein
VSFDFFFLHYFDSSLTFFSQRRKATTERAPQPQLFKLSQVWSQAQRTLFSLLKWVNSTNLGSNCLPYIYLASLTTRYIVIVSELLAVVHGPVILTVESVRLFSWSLIGRSVFFSDTFRWK